jgi:hypothetical protein
MMHSWATVLLLVLCGGPVKGQDANQEAGLLDLYRSTQGDAWDVWERNSATFVQWGTPRTSYCR